MRKLWIVALALVASVSLARGDYFTDMVANSPPGTTAVGKIPVVEGVPPLARTHYRLSTDLLVSFIGFPDAVKDAAGLTVLAGSTAIGGITTTASDVGKLFFAPGIGVDGGLFSTTIAAAGRFAAAPAVSTGSFYASDIVDYINPPIGSGYVPGEVITLTNGGATCSILPQVTVGWTGVSGATIANAGATGVDGTYAVRGTVGGTRPGGGSANNRVQAEVTVAGGVITSVDSIIWGGQYNAALQPVVAAEPVLPLLSTFAGLTGAELTLAMGVRRPYITRPGVCTVASSGTWTQSATSGSGTGAQFTLTMTAAGTYTMGTDNSAALAAAMARTDNAVIQAGIGNYLIGCQTYTAGSKITLRGEGRLRTFFIVVPGCEMPPELFLWNGTDGGGFVDVTIDLNGAVGGSAVGDVAVSYIGSNLVIDSSGIINAGSAGLTNLTLVRPRANGNTATRWIIQNSNFSFLKSSQMQTHAVNVSPINGGETTGGLLFNNVVTNTNLTGVYGSTAVINNQVTGWGYGPAIGTSGQAGPFPWLFGNYIAGNNLYNSAVASDGSVSQGEDGEWPNCIESPGNEATVLGNRGSECAGGYSIYNSNVKSANNKWKNNQRRFDSVKFPYTFVSVLAGGSGNPARDGSGFSSVGDTVIDDTGRTNLIAFGEFETGGALTGNTIKGLQIVGPVQPTSEGTTNDVDSSGGVSARTDFQYSTMLRRVVRALPAASIEFLSLPIEKMHHGKLECSDLTPAAAAQLQIQVGVAGVFQTANYRQLGVNPITTALSGTGNAPFFWDASTSAITVGTALMSTVGNNTFTATFGDLSVATANKFKNIHYQAAYRETGNETVMVTGGGTWNGGANAITDLRLIFVDGGAVQQDFARGDCSLKMWW